MTSADAGSAPPAAWLRACRQRTRKLPALREYWTGLEEAAPALPDNLLLFRRRQSLAAHPPNMHDRWMLIVSLQTAGSVILDEQLVRLEQGWGVLVFPHQFHQYGEPDAQRLLWLFLTFELASGAALELLRNRPVRLAPAAGHTLETVLQAWEGAVGSGSHEAGVRLRLASALLLRQLLDAGDPAGRPAVPLATPDPGAAELVRRVTRYASEHLEEPLRVADLAEALAVSPSHLARRFRRAAGVSIGAYLRRYRLKRAAGYLAGSERTVSEAARHCGFDSIYAFSRAFKREFGVPPSRYRQALRRGDLRHAGGSRRRGAGGGR